MDPIHVLALGIFLLLLAVAAALEFGGTWRLTARLRSLFKQRSSDDSRS